MCRASIRKDIIAEMAALDAESAEILEGIRGML